MIFSSAIFLFLFLPLVLSGSLLLPRVRLRNGLLLAASILFYAWGEPVFILLLAGSTLANCVLGRWIEAAREGQQRRRLVCLALVVNLGLLAFFKYGQFALQNLNAVLHAIHLPSLTIRQLRLPLGISFFTFHAISYIVDVYRRNSRAARSVSELALYIFLFPQLIAGPIMRWAAMAPQLTARLAHRDRIWQGIRRFILGLAKKVLIANTVALPVDRIFALPPGALSPLLAWAAVIGYTLQIYFDFSGYSDMAIGLGKMFGFEFIENFRYPYAASSIRDFWHRWHISLTTWFRDYLYIPLGGNRGPRWRTVLNLLLVFLLCGLWHGARWTFVAWGLYHGFFLVLERTPFGRFLGRVPAFFQHLYTLAVVMLGWVLFRADSWTQALAFLRNLFGLWSALDAVTVSRVAQVIMSALCLRDFRAQDELALSSPILAMSLTPAVVWAAIAGAVFAVPFVPFALREFKRLLPQKLMFALHAAAALGEPILLLAVFIVSAAFVADGTYNPFIYYRF